MARRRTVETQIRIRMSFLLFPGRHLVNTTFQEQYLKRVLTEPSASLPGFIPRRAAAVAKQPTEIIFAITSSNQENSRFNPIPFHIRSVGVDRFARQLQKHLHHSATACWGFLITVTPIISPPSPSRKSRIRVNTTSGSPPKIASCCAPPRKSSGYIRSSGFASRPLKWPRRLRVP